jgi:hypothetical protein
VEIAISMKVMVTSNIKTDLDVTNGAHGEIVDIILHPDEYGGHRVHGLNLEVLCFDFSDFNASFQSSEARSSCLPNYYVFQLYLYSY